LLKKCKTHPLDISWYLLRSLDIFTLGVFMMILYDWYIFRDLSCIQSSAPSYATRLALLRSANRSKIIFCRFSSKRRQVLHKTRPRAAKSKIKPQWFEQNNLKKTIIKDSLIKGFEDYATHMARSKPTISSETGRTQDLIRVPPR
jgi:hypothetical protein